MKKGEKDQSGYKPNETYQDLEPHYTGECQENWDDPEITKFGIPDNYSVTKFNEERRRVESANLAVKYLMSQEQRVKPDDLSEYMNTILNFLNTK